MGDFSAYFGFSRHDAEAGVLFPIWKKKYYLSYDVDEKCRHTVLGFANSSVTANFFFFIINSGSEAILS
jgi:hypothetical protein